MRDNLLYDNGFAADGNSLLDARWNWWGDSTGPYHSTRNSQGQGEEVQGDLLFDPWYPDTSFISDTSAYADFFAPLPAEFVFYAYPNPFNGIVHFTLTPADVQLVNVKLFDVLGREVAEVWRGPLAFRKEISFDASQLSSGIYFARVTDTISRKQMAMRKLVLMK
jgi:hypothetical protein